MTKLNSIQNFPLEIDDGLDSFLMNWDRDYKNVIQCIELFNPELTKKWTHKQKVYFTKVFYHARGHFHDFLWYLGNHTESKTVKDIILKNIAEEMNGSALSHEQLYIDFAKCVGADLEREFVDEETYLDSIREFNKGHIRWLSSHDDEYRLAAFSAYERLDNIDYTALMELIISLNVPQKGQLFFKIHTRVQHFETTTEELKTIWHHNPQKVKEAFHFISKHQIKMWNDLSKGVFSYQEN